MSARIAAAVRGDLSSFMAAEIRGSEIAVTAAAREVDGRMKAEIRRAIRGIYGPRVANAWRGTVYPKSGVSTKAAIYQREAGSERFIRSLVESGPIKSENGFWLAIPLPASEGLIPKSLRHSRPRRGASSMSTAIEAVEAKVGRLQFVMPGGSGRGQRAYLVANNLRQVKSRAKSGPAFRFSGRRTASGKGRGEASAAMFLLVPQVRRAGRVDLNRIANNYTGEFAREIVTRWPEILT